MANIAQNRVAIHYPNKDLLLGAWSKIEDAFRSHFPDAETENGKIQFDSASAPPINLVSHINDGFPGFEFLLSVTIEHEHYESWLIREGDAYLIEKFYIAVREIDVAWFVHNGKIIEVPSGCPWVADVPLIPFPTWAPKNLAQNRVAIHHPNKDLLLGKWSKIEDAFRKNFPDSETKNGEIVFDSESEPPYHIISHIKDGFPGFEFLLSVTIENEHCESWLFRKGEMYLIEKFYVEIPLFDIVWFVQNGKLIEVPSGDTWVADVPLIPFPTWTPKNRL
jgi:hypothetical protein